MTGPSVTMMSASGPPRPSGTPSAATPYLRRPLALCSIWLQRDWRPMALHGSPVPRHLQSGLMRSAAGTTGALPRRIWPRHSARLQSENCRTGPAVLWARRPWTRGPDEEIERTRHCSSGCRCDRRLREPSDGCGGPQRQRLLTVDGSDVSTVGRQNPPVRE